MLQGSGESGIGVAVRREHAHARHLHDEHGECLVALGDASLQAAEVLPAALRRGIGEHADPIGLLSDPLHLGEYAAVPRFDVEVEPGVPMGALRADHRPASERLPLIQIF